MGNCLATRHTLKTGGCCHSAFCGQPVSPSNTMSPGQRPTSVPNGMLIRIATTDMCQKLGGCAPFEGSWVPHSIMWPEPRPATIPSDILNPNPSNHLATIKTNVTHRTGRQDRQWSDSTGPTILQMVAQWLSKLKLMSPTSKSVVHIKAEKFDLFHV